VAARVRRVLGDSRGAALINALTVGDQQGIAPDDWRLFSRTGVTHLVSISGVHVGMVAGLVALLARRVLRRFSFTLGSLRVAVSMCGLFAAGSYSLLAGWSVPTRRTFFMLAVTGVLLLWRRALSPFQIWWLALAITLLMDPFAVFFPGLWLSFGLVAALMLVVNGRVRGPGKWHAMLLGQWAATVMSIVPLILFFSTLPLISPLANAVAIPFVSVILAPLSLLAVAFPHDCLLFVAGWLVDLFYLLIGFLGRVPVFYLPGIPWPLLLLAFIGSLWLIAPAGIFGRGLGALMLLPMFCHSPPRPQTGHAWITVLDVGQGLSVLVRTARHSLLYDTGALAADKVVLPQLRGVGIRQLQMLVLSHNDSDHDGAAGEVLNMVPADELLVGQPASAGARAHSQCRPGRRWDWDGVHFEILGPLPRIMTPGNNAQSCVLRLATRRHSLLLAGDIPAVVESALLARYGSALASSVLVAPHHGSQTSSSSEFLRSVMPHHVVVSAGYRNRYGHPHAAVMARFQKHGAGAVRTDLLGSLDIRFERQLTVTGYRLSRPRYWRP